MNFAIIETGGNQYKVSKGETISVEKLEDKVGDTIVFDKVLLVTDGDKVSVGQPYVEKTKVETKVVEHGRGDKKIVYKYKAKKRSRKKRGHRQPYTKLEILGVK